MRKFCLESAFSMHTFSTVSIFYINIVVRLKIKILILPVSVSQSFIWLSKEVLKNSVPSLLKQISFTGNLWPTYVLTNFLLPNTSQSLTYIKQILKIIMGNSYFSIHGAGQEHVCTLWKPANGIDCFCMTGICVGLFSTRIASIWNKIFAQVCACILWWLHKRPTKIVGVIFYWKKSVYL